MRWRRNPCVLWRVAPTYLVVSTVEGRVADADGPAAAIWTRLADWIDESTLIEALALEFAVDELSIRADVQAFLRQLHAEGYIDAAG